MKDTRSEYKKTYGQNKFEPTSSNPKPWKLVESMIWHKVQASNGKTVCNCRNIKDAELIVKLVNGN